jgi:hypothetical protein
MKNIMNMVKKWAANIKKGEECENYLGDFLISKGYQVNRVVSWNYEKSDAVFGDAHKEGTLFSPDFLTCGNGELFFADSKGKSTTDFRGWVNKSDYDKYFDVMSKIDGIGFKLYFPIKDTGKIWVMDKLVDPSHFPTITANDGRSVYKIPTGHLRLCD